MGKILSQGGSKWAEKTVEPWHGHADMRTPHYRLIHDSKLYKLLVKCDSFDCLVNFWIRQMAIRYLSNIRNSIFLRIDLRADPSSPASGFYHWVGRRRGNLVIMRIRLGTGLLPSQYLFAFFLQSKKRQMKQLLRMYDSICSSATTLSNHFIFMLIHLSI